MKKYLLQLLFGKPIKGEPMQKEREIHPPAMPFDNISYYQWVTREWKNHFNKSFTHNQKTQS